MGSNPDTGRGCPLRCHHEPDLRLAWRGRRPPALKWLPGRELSLFNPVAPQGSPQIGLAAHPRAFAPLCPLEADQWLRRLRIAGPGQALWVALPVAEPPSHTAGDEHKQAQTCERQHGHRKQVLAEQRSIGSWWLRGGRRWLRCVFAEGLRSGDSSGRAVCAPAGRAVRARGRERRLRIAACCAGCAVLHGALVVVPGDRIPACRGRAGTRVQARPPARARAAARAATAAGVAAARAAAGAAAARAAATARGRAAPTNRRFDRRNWTTAASAAAPAAARAAASVIAG
jgi:hypothetical protein